MLIGNLADLQQTVAIIMDIAGYANSFWPVAAHGVVVEVGSGERWSSAFATSAPRGVGCLVFTLGEVWRWRWLGRR